MIVCICHRVSDRDIRHQANACASFDELQFETRVGTGCGRCGDCAQSVFHEARRSGAQHPTPGSADCRIAPAMAA